MKTFEKESQNIVFGTPVALVLLSILIFLSKQAQADSELWKAFILVITSNIVMVIYLTGLALFWRTVRRNERQDEKEK